MCILTVLSIATSVLASPVDTKLVIRDDRSAEGWDTAYPTGNGRLGAMPFGQFPKEKVIINEETIWARKGGYDTPEDSFQQLEKMRALEAKGDYSGVDTVFQDKIQDGRKPSSYQPLGWLNLEYQSAASMKQTRRSLDLKTGIAQSVYTLEDGTEITQRTFVSSPDDVIVVAVSASRKIGLRISLDKEGIGRVILSKKEPVAVEEAAVKDDGNAKKGKRAKKARKGADKAETATLENGDTAKSPESKGEDSTIEIGDIVKSGDGKNDATKFIGRVRVTADGSVTSGSKAIIEVKDSTSITIYLAAATNFDLKNSRAMRPDGWQAKALRDLDALKNKSVNDVEKAAVEDHRKYFNRVDADFGTTADAVLALPTRERLARIKAGKNDDPDLVEEYFQFGRYLLIASSRPGTFPANLQGIWNDSGNPPWGSDYHLNINIQMNYWPAETANLSDLHSSLFCFIRYCQPNGKDFAKRLGMKGWCMGHCTDIWAHAMMMASKAFWGGSFFGGQWMTLHILENYRFSRDKKVLEENWDVLTASTEFVESWLIPAPEAGKLMARPSCSPENSFKYTDKSGNEIKAAMSAGNSFDQWMILQVFNDYVEAAEALGKGNDPFVKKVKETIPKILVPKIATDGRLMEWRLPFEEKEKGHRHISHIIGAYPGNQINIDRDPKMRAAVMKSIEYRLENTGGRKGWSRAWTTGLFARFCDKKRAYEDLMGMLQLSTLDNLWNLHPPFQIDGNFGATAAVCEMLLHSHNNEIKLLPTLPDAWPTGHINGLRARGDYTVDIAWKDGKLDTATILAGKNATPGIYPVVYNGISKLIEFTPGQKTTVTKEQFGK